MFDNALASDIASYQYDARPDTLDFRDRMYEPTLVEVPTHVDLQDYLKFKVISN